MRNSSRNLASSVVLLLFSIKIVLSDPPYCVQVDFNRPTFDEFVKCKNKFLPLFVIRDYERNPSITPYRPTSEYFLSANNEGFTCAESSATYFLNSSSRIDAAIFLSYENRGAYVEIIVLDADRNNIPVYSWKNDSSNGWYTIWGRIGKEIKNAKIEIHTNMNLNSHMAIEYLNVLNSEIPSAECIKSPATTTTIATTTIASTTTSTSTTTTSTATTALPTIEPITITDADSSTSSTTDSDDPNTTIVNDAAEEKQSFLGISDRVWKILVPVSTFIILFSLCALIYAVFWYRNESDKLQLIDVADGSAKAPYNPNDAMSIYSNQTTLPRLKVIDDKDNGISIIGIEQSEVTHVGTKAVLSNR